MTTENLLSKIFESHTGKYSDKWNSYLDIYWDLFSPICHNDSDILEIGIQNGGSLEIWAKLFPNAKNLIGFDVHTKCTELKFSDPRIKVFVEDAADEKSGSLVQKTTSNLGVVIDDGSHVSQDIIRSFLIFFPQLKPGGIFVIEDLHASYWSDWQGGISHPESSMQFLKLLADIVNFDHWGIKDKRTDIFELIPATYGQLEESTLASIESITFFDSVCVVRKKSHTNQGLGLRIGSGSEAIVYPEAKDSVGAASLAPNQELNPFGISKDLSLGQLQIYKTQHQELQTQHQELQTQHQELQTQHQELQTQHQELQTQHQELQTQHQELQTQHQELQTQHQELQTQHQELQTQNSQLSESIRAIQATLSWKVTKPLRYIKSKLSRGG